MHDSATAILFPGQGSQTADMRDVVVRARPDLLDLAAEVVGEDPFGRVGQGTRFDQPAIFCAGLAGWELLGRPTPGFFAGHSLGELTALTAAGALSDEDGLRLVAERGRLTDLAAAGAAGGMLALRVDREQASEIARATGAVVANDNAPRQVVLSGSKSAITAAAAEAEAAGVLAKRLPVAAAFHSPAMEPAVEPFAAALAAAEFADPVAPVYSCVTCAPFGDPRVLLTQALVSPVRWLETLRALQVAGACRFVEAGPGTVLTGTVRRSLQGVETDAVAAREAVGA